jgi:hypothetical protein
MNSTKKSFRLAAISLIAAVVAGGAAACSGDDNNGNPAPSNDGGNNSDVTMSGDDSSTSTGDSSTSTGDSSMPPSDAPSLDTGSCKSTMPTCNTCYTAAQAGADPYNACTAYTSKCVPFDPTRVPTHPTL